MPTKAEFDELINSIKDRIAALEIEAQRTDLTADEEAAIFAELQALRGPSPAPTP